MHGHGGYFDSDDIVGKVYDSGIFKRLLNYAKPYWKYVVLGIILLVSFSLVKLLWPQLVRIGIDNYILNNSIDNTAKLNGIVKISLVYFASVIVFALCKYLMMYVTYYMGQSIIHNIRVELFSHMEKLSVRFFTKNPVGRLVILLFARNTFSSLVRRSIASGIPVSWLLLRINSLVSVKSPISTGKYCNPL